MVSEKICLEILQCLRGKVHTLTQTIVKGPGSGEVTESQDSDSLVEIGLYRLLLPRHNLQQIDAAVRWLHLCDFMGTSRMSGSSWYVLTEKGRTAADKGRLPEEDRRLLYQEDPYAVFLAHQFHTDDEELIGYLRSQLLKPHGFRPVDGRAEGLEEFRHSILHRIAGARFFICLLTKRTPLQSGLFVSSVWLYQEIGAAMALGKKPLLLVEQGIDPDYIGELQKVYEHISFTRSNHPRQFGRVLDRLHRDLEMALIPAPAV